MQCYPIVTTPTNSIMNGLANTWPYTVGSGKSSIVCAVCLGLTGSPTILGRAKQVGWRNL